MIDLSFLTEEEQEAIMKVLQRDAELKRAEEERVRHLPEKVKDDVQLKNMSGQWFYEAKSKRHRDKIHGADIIRASMRRKPATLAEVSQNKSNKAKNSWVSNVNKEVFVPPELHGIVEHQEEQQPQSCSSSKTITSMLDTSEERPTKSAVSPVKQRRNPFNFTASGDNLNSGESEERPAILPQLSNKEVLSPSKESQPKPNLENDDTEEPKKPSVDPTDETQKGLVKRPVPKARKLIHKTTAPVYQREDVPKAAKRTERINGIGTAPRGILKRSSSSSSTDSEVRVSQMLDVQKNGLPTATIFEGEAEKNSLVEEAENSTQISLEKLKQVRFSSGTGKGEPLQSPQLHHSRDKGEFDLLEFDETKSSENDVLRSDTFGNKQTSAVKPLETCSSALQVKTIDGLQIGSSASSPCDTNRSVFSVNETLQAKTINPKKPENPQKTSKDILPNSSDKPRVETHESETNQFLSHESKPHKSINDEHQLSAKTEVCDVPNTNYESLQQGKPHLVEEKHAKTAFKLDKHADELMKVNDESVSRVLDWFKRSSVTEDKKPVSARSQGREPKEDMGFSTGTAGLPTQYSMDRKTEVKEELSFGKLKQWNSISSTSFISEDKQLIKERMEPKKGEENEGQSEKSLTGSGCTRVEEKHGQEITQPNQKSDLLVHQEHEVPAQKGELEKAIRERRRIREIRAFWEGNKTFPIYGEKEVDTNVSRGSGEKDKIKPTAVYLPNGLDDQSKNALRGAELSCASQASRNKHQNSFEFGQGHAVQKPESTLLSDGKVHENTELPKASNLQPRLGPTSASPESEGKDEKETLKRKLAATSQQKPSFQVLSSKEKMNENSKDQISDPSHFQSLRNFWDSGVKLQSSIDRVGVSLPNNTSSITYERKENEDDKGRDKQELIQQQTQTLERETNKKPDSVVCGLPLQSPALKDLNATYTKNRESVQLGRKAVISKPQESVDLPEREVKGCVDKSIASSKEHHVSLQLHQSPGDKDTFKEEAEDDCLCLSMEKVENKITPLEISLPKEEVAETIDKVILPKAEFDVFKLGLKKLENEASEMSSSLNLEENILKGTTFHSDQCKVPERSVEQSHDTSPANGKEEMSKNTGGVNVLPRDEHGNKNSLRKLFREFEPFHLQLQPAEKDDTLWGSQRPQAGSLDLLRETFASQPSEYRRVGMKTSDYRKMSQTNCSVKSTCQEDNGQPEEVNETTEVSVVPPKVSGLSSALEKLMKEASETPPPKPKRAIGTEQRAAEVEVKGTTYKHDGELLQEIRETVEKSVTPPKVSGLSSALEKLMEEVSEMPPPKPQHADSTEQRAAELKVKSMTYEHDGEVLQEIRETVEKSVIPPKVSGLSSALEKLMKEASETPPPKPKRAIGTEQRAAEVEVEGTTYKHDGELLQEIRETVEKSITPPKVNGLSSALEKLMEEASEMPPPKPQHADSTEQRAAELKVKSMTYEHDGEVLQEIRETVEKSITPPKVSGLSSALEKLMKEASETPPPKPKRAIGTEQRAAEVEVEGTTYKHDGELLQEIRETVEKSITPPKVNGLSSALEKLMEEASEMPPPKPQHADSTEQRAAELKVKSMTYEHDGEVLQEIRETVEKSITPPKVSGLSSALEKLMKEASETPPPKPKRAISTEQRAAEMEAKSMTYEHDGEVLQEIVETVERSVLSKADYGLLDVHLQKLLKEASETPASELKDRNMQGKMQTSQSMHVPHQQERDNPQEVQERVEKTSISNIEKISEFSSSLEKLLQEAPETSSPLPKELHKQDGNNFPQPEGAQFCLTSQCEDNEEEEGDGSCCGYKFSDENSDSYSGTGSSIRSEELNPVLMALKRSADRKMPSKSLEDIPSATSNKRKINNPKEELALSAEDVSTVPSQPDKLFSNPDKLKGLSKSVPSFLQEESDDRETDTASESSYSLGRIKKSPSSLTNLSGSSGMASLSSVSGSLMSIYSADFGNVDVKGNIQFAIDYVEQLNELHVFICQCKDLAVADVKRQRSDPYVKTYLLPEKYKLGKRKTSVKKKTFNPVYNEILRYKIEKDLLKNQSLNISVWHNDTFGRNSFLGEVELDLGMWDWNDKSNKQINWFPLKPRTSTISLQPENRGAMKLALQYVPHPVGGKKTLSTGEVHIWVKECHDLPLLRGNKLNSFIKCTVLPDTSRKSRQKTRTVAKTTNPVFNHTMVYDGFRPEDLKEACVELTVWDHNKLANHFLGGLRIGLGTGKSYGTVVDWMDSTLAETALWEKMMNSPNKWVEDTLPLRMLMVAKLTK